MVKLLKDDAKTHEAIWIVGGDDGLGTLYLCKTSFQAYQVERGMAQADLVVSVDQVVEMEVF